MFTISLRIKGLYKILYEKYNKFISWLYVQYR